MNSIILGWANVDGSGECVLVCSPSVEPGAQAILLHNSQHLQEFPKGIKRLQLIAYDDGNSSISVYLGDEAYKQVQARKKAVDKQQADAAAAHAARQKHAAELESAQEAFNNAKNHLAKLTSVKPMWEQKVIDLTATFKHTGDKQYQLAAANAQETLEKIVKQWTEAMKAQDETEKALSKLKNK